MKPGYRSTEFWIALVAQIVGAFMASGLFADGSTWARGLGLAAMVLTGMGYSVSRGMVKSSAPLIPTAIDSTSLRTGAEAKAP